MKKFNLGLISSNRKTIYGLSCLWIVLFHSTVDFSQNPITKIIDRIKIIGDCGVDIFLFVSGISLYFALCKDHSLKHFYLRRLKRIIFPTLCVTIPWFAFFSAETPARFWNYIADITTFSFFTTGNQCFWFVTAILIFYAMYPIIYRALNNSDNSLVCLLILLCCCLLFNGTLHFLFPSFYFRVGKMLRRIPIFIIGAYCGKFVYEKKQISLSYIQIITILIVSVILSFAINKIMPQIIHLQYTYIPVALGVTAVFSLLGNVSAIKFFASLFAPVSLEIYLCFERWQAIIPRIIPLSSVFFVDVISLILSIITSYIILCVFKKITGFRFSYK